MKFSTVLALCCTLLFVSVDADAQPRCGGFGPKPTEGKTFPLVEVEPQASVVIGNAQILIGAICINDVRYVIGAETWTEGKKGILSAMPRSNGGWQPCLPGDPEVTLGPVN
mgnify:CR=1 FL=1